MDTQLNLGNDHDEFHTDNFVQSLFQNVKPDERFIESFESIHVPNQPVEATRDHYTFTVPRRTTNTWTQLSSMILNVGVRFEKFVNNAWTGVLESDKAVPVSNLVRCLFNDIEIRLSQTRVTSSNDVNPQIVGILDMLTNSQQHQATLG